MNDLTELERRVTAALDRIASHVSELERPAAAPEPEADTGLPPAAELMADLEAERAVTAQLEERVRTVREKLDNRIGILQSDLSLARDRIAHLEEETANLREEATSRAENEGESGALRAELAQLRAEREQERAELAEILAELTPIVEESGHV